MQFNQSMIDNSSFSMMCVTSGDPACFCFTLDGVRLGSFII
jgi:hypothetical protein